MSGSERLAWLLSLESINPVVWELLLGLHFGKPGLYLLLLPSHRSLKHSRPFHVKYHGRPLGAST